LVCNVAPVTAPPTLDRLRARRDRILAIAARYGASDVRVFGSAARGDARLGSDVDLVVRLAPGRTLLDLGAMQYELAELLGLDVDVLTEGALTGELAAHVRREARAL